MPRAAGRRAWLAALALALSPSSSKQGQRHGSPLVDQPGPRQQPAALVEVSTLDFVVSVGASASQDEIYAAEMISDELGKKTCGQALPVVAPNATAGRPTIAVGGAALAFLTKSKGLPALLPTGSAGTLGDDGYVIVGGGTRNWLALSGRAGSPRGTSYAAVEFLVSIPKNDDFPLKNDDFPLKNDDFRLANDDSLLANDDFCTNTGGSWA